MPVRSRVVSLVAVVAALSLLPHPAVGDERDELAKTRRRLGQVEAVLGDARADADQAVVGARRRAWPSRSAAPT
jgi:hypothetical protein